MICKNCKHWRCDDDEWAYTEITHIINPETYETEDELARFCNSPKLKFYETPDDGGASVVDGSRYRARLITNPNFGCVNFCSLQE